MAPWGGTRPRPQRAPTGGGAGARHALAAAPPGAPSAAPPRGRRRIPWPSLLAPRARAARDGGPHGGDHRRGGLETLQAGRAQGLVLGPATDGVEGLRDRPGSARAVTPDAALQGNPVGGVAAGAEARRDRLARRAAALGVVASRVHVLRHRLQARCLLRGVTWTTRCGLAVGVVVVRLPPVACLWCLRHGLVGRPLWGGHGRCHGLAQLRLPMAEVRGGMRPEVVVSRRQPARCCITGGWHALAMAARPGLLQQSMPGVVSACLGRWLQAPAGAHRRDPPEAQTARQRVILRQRDGFGGHRVRPTRAFLVAVWHAGLFHATVDLRRRSLEH